MTVVKFRFLYALSGDYSFLFSYFFSRGAVRVVFLSTIVVTAAVENVYEYQRELQYFSAATTSSPQSCAQYFIILRTHVCKVSKKFFSRLIAKPCRLPVHRCSFAIHKTICLYIVYCVRLA